MAHSIHPCLWFDGTAHEAAHYYCSIFPDARILSENPMVVNFELNGQTFMGLNGGPQFTFNEPVSFVVSCETQGEIDHHWDQLTDGGQEGNCGWLKDKYGLSWQIVPTILPKLLGDHERAPRVMAAFRKMKKFDIEALKNA
ncbi:MAG: VOC family protein [Lewinella sp.]